jgi:hypothetical protein
VSTLVLVHLALGVIAALVMVFVAYPYRGRPLPRAERLSDRVAAVAERVDPGEGPPLGVLSSPEKSRAMSARFERVERLLRRGARALVPAGRH